jgi:Amt family ammonium transporter
VVVVISIVLMERLKVDDPVGAIAAHGFAGAWGTIAVGLFAEAAFGEASGMGAINGLFFGGGITQLWYQFIGVFAAFVWVFPVSYVIFYAISKTVGMRASDEDQIRGLDISEHEAAGYPDFAPALPVVEEEHAIPAPATLSAAPGGAH